MPNIPQSELPIPKSWDDFEDICWDLYTRLWEDPHADRYGRSGERQHGVDVLGHAKYLDGELSGVQCKRYRVGTLTRAKIKAEIEEADKFTPPLAEFIIATTDARTASIQSFVEQTSQERKDAGKFPVYIAFWDTLCGLLTNPEYENTLLKHYGEWVALAMRASPSTALVLPLPADLADFTGRAADINKVRAQLDRQSAVTITGIHGMGGIGKTALAVHVAHQLVAEGRFPDAQLYIDLKGDGTSPVDPVDALDSLLNAILAPDPNRPRDLNTLSALWRQAIDGQDALLILDNAADAAQVRPLLPGCPTCAVLVTSRRRFTLPGARRLDLRPMRRPEARDLLQQLAPHLDDDGADQIAGLCGRLPQALRIAGNYLNLNDDVTPEDYGGMLAGERTRLAQLRDPDHPDLNVYATISLSVDQLDASTRSAWALLSLFPAPFDLPAATALWDQPEDQNLTRLQALRNRSLVTYDPDSRRYHQHDLVRLAAAGDLGALPEGESLAAHLRMARHYEQVACEANSLYLQGGDNVLEALAVFDLEWPHLRTALDSAHLREDDSGRTLLISLARAVENYLDLRGLSGQRKRWLEEGIDCAQELGEQWAEADLLNRLGLTCADLGETNRAIEHHTAALEIAREIGDRRAEGKDLGNLGNAYASLGERHKAIEQHTAALEIAREIGDRSSEGAWLGNLGLTYADLGETHKAIEHYQQALEIAREIGDRSSEGAWLGNLGLAYADLGETHQPIEQYTAALEIAREIGDRSGEGSALGNLGLAHAGLGEMHQAIEHYQHALGIARDIGDRRNEGIWLGNLGKAYAGLGETHQPIEQYTAALEIAREIGDRRNEGVWLGNLGSVYFDLGEVRKAQSHFAQQLSIAQRLGDSQGQANAFWSLGNTHADLGETEQATEKYQESLALLEAIGDPEAKRLRRILAELED